MVEILVTAVLVVLVSFAIITTIVALQPQGQESTNYLMAAKAGSQVLAILRGQLNADSWNSAPFLPGANYSQVIDGYNVVHYTVDHPSGGREVFISVYDP